MRDPMHIAATSSEFSQARQVIERIRETTAAGPSLDTTSAPVAGQSSKTGERVGSLGPSTMQLVIYLLQSALALLRVSKEGREP
jgi:hypothetical protein